MRALTIVFAVVLGAAAAAVPAAHGAVTTQPGPSGTQVLALDSGALLHHAPGRASGLRLRPQGASVPTPVTVDGADPFVDGVTPLPGGRALIAGSTTEGAGLWGLGPDGVVRPVPLGAGEGLVPGTLRIERTVAGGVVGAWDRPGGDRGVWAAYLVDGEVRARALEPPFVSDYAADPIRVETLRDVVVTPDGRVVALGVLNENAVVARINEPGSTTWSAPVIAEDGLRFETALYFKDDARLAVAPDGAVSAVWSAAYPSEGDVERVREARLLPDGTFTAPTTVGPKSAEVQMRAVFDVGGDLVVSRKTGARNPDDWALFTGRSGGPFSLAVQDASVEDETQRGDVLLKRFATQESRGYLVRTRRDPAKPAVLRDLNAAVGAAPDAIASAALDPTGDGAAAAWSDGQRVLASVVAQDGPVRTTPVACGASGGQIAVGGGRAAVLVTLAGGDDAVAFATSAGWRTVQLPARSTWTLAQSRTGQLAVVGVAGVETTEVSIDALPGDGTALPERGIDCAVPDRLSLEVEPTSDGNLRVTVHCPRVRTCAGALVADRIFPPAFGWIRVAPGASATTVLRLAASVRPRVLRGAVRPRVTLVGPWFRPLASATVGVS